MHVRLLRGSTEQGVISVYPLLCMDCEGDTFEWMDSWEAFDVDTWETFNIGQYRCTHCGYTVALNENTFLVEGTDEVAGWLSRRHTHKGGQS